MLEVEFLRRFGRLGMEWMVLGFVLIHLLLLIGVVVALIHTSIVRDRRSKRRSVREEHAAHSAR